MSSPTCFRVLYKPKGTPQMGPWTVGWTFLSPSLGAASDTLARVTADDVGQYDFRLAECLPTDFDYVNIDEAQKEGA